MNDEQKARLEELKAKDQETLTEEEKTELGELEALNPDKEAAKDAGSNE